MKELFKDIDEIKEEPTQVVEKSDKKWWQDGKCTFCGGTDGLWVAGNGIIRCKKHYVNKA